jgi:hypothetical protein
VLGNYRARVDNVRRRRVARVVLSRIPDDEEPTGESDSDERRS